MAIGLCKWCGETASKHIGSSFACDGRYGKNFEMGGVDNGAEVATLLALNTLNQTMQSLEVLLQHLEMTIRNKS